MSTPVSNIIYNNTYNVHNHGECHGIQFGKSNLIQETSIHSEDDDLRSQIEDLRFEMNKKLDHLACMIERKDKDIAELRDKVANLEKTSGFKARMVERKDKDIAELRDKVDNLENTPGLKFLTHFALNGWGALTKPSSIATKQGGKLLRPRRKIRC